MKKIMEATREVMQQLKRYAALKDDWRTQDLLENTSLQARMDDNLRQTALNDERMEQLEDLLERSLSPEQAELKISMDNARTEMDTFGEEAWLRARDAFRSACKKPAPKDIFEEMDRLQHDFLERLNPEESMLYQQQLSLLRCPIPGDLKQEDEHYLTAVGDIIEGISRRLQQKAGSSSWLSTKYHMTDSLVIALKADDPLAYSRGTLPRDHLEQIDMQMADVEKEIAQTAHWKRSRTTRGTMYIIESELYPHGIAYDVAQALSNLPQFKGKTETSIIHDGQAMTPNEYSSIEGRKEQLPTDKQRLIIPEEVAKEIMPLMGVDRLKIRSGQSRA